MAQWTALQLSKMSAGATKRMDNAKDVGLVADADAEVWSEGCHGCGRGGGWSVSTPSAHLRQRRIRSR